MNYNPATWAFQRTYCYRYRYYFAEPN